MFYAARTKRQTFAPSLSGVFRNRYALLLIALLFAIAARVAQAQSNPLEPPGAGSARIAREAAKRGEELRRRWALESAEAAFREAASVDPANLEAALGLARIAQARFDYVEAKRLLDGALRDHPRSADLFAGYGSLYIAAEETSRALEYFDRALSIDPQSAAAEIGRAETDLLRRNYNSAEARLRERIGRNPQDGRAHSVLSRVLLEDSRTREAAEEAERALLMDPFDTDALHALAFARAVERKSDEVRLLARRALALNPSNAAIRRLLAQYINGKAGYEQRIGELARRRYERGMSLKQDGRLTDAMAEFDAALQIEPRYYRALIAMGDVWLREENYARAAAVASRAIEVDADGSVAHLQLSYALLGMQ